MFQPTFNENKFQGLILYSAQRAMKDKDRYFGAVKLNKTLFYADFISFKRHGRPITGATYQKLREGPAPRQLLRQRSILIDSGKLEIKPTQVFNYVQSRLIPTEPVSTSEIFSQNEVAIIDEVIDEFDGLTAAQVSEISHKEPGWIMAKVGDDIPYETSLLDPVFSDGESELTMRRATGK